MYLILGYVLAFETKIKLTFIFIFYVYHERNVTIAIVKRLNSIFNKKIYIFNSQNNIKYLLPTRNILLILSRKYKEMQRVHIPSTISTYIRLPILKSYADCHWTRFLVIFVMSTVHRSILKPDPLRSIHVTIITYIIIHII